MTNHNQLPVATPELSAEERAVLSVAKLNEWRSRQYSLLNGLREADNFSNPDYLEAFYSSVDESLDDFLQEQGIDTDSPNYGDIHALFYDARIGTDNGNGISEDAWGNSPASRGLDPDDHKSQSDIFRERIAARLANETDTEEPVDMEALHVEALLDNARFDVDKNRDSWAKAASKRVGSAFFHKGKKSDEIKSHYHESVQKLGKLELQTILEDDTVSAQDKNIAVITFLFDEQKKLREKTLENLNGTKVSRFVQWMGKGNVATRIAKGLLIGGAAGVVGGVAAGAAGAGVIAAGAVAGSRFVKGYAAKDKHRGSKMPEKLDDVDTQDSDDTKIVLEHLADSSSADTLSAAAEKVNSFFEDDVNDERKERKKALAVGALSVAAGAGLGYLVSDIGPLDEVKDKVKDWLGGASNDDRPSVGGADPSDHGSGHIIDHDNDGIRDGKDPFVDTNGDGFDDRSGVLNPELVSHDARWVDPGEGWYQTFQELGIPEDHWNDVLENAGPKLHEQGWAYFDESANEWRISQPGRLPDASLRVIAKAASRDGFDLAA